nr:septum formation initiator family protein [Desulfuromonadales bacterium]NIS39941.1 septum formation initiator family protein [Desulfuromonadales bacterium]
MSSSESPPKNTFLGLPGRLALLIVIAMLALALFGEKGVLRAYKLSRERQLLEEELRHLQKDNEELRREIDLLRNDLEYLEDVARRELGLVKDDEL